MEIAPEDVVPEILKEAMAASLAEEVHCKAPMLIGLKNATKFSLCCICISVRLIYTSEPVKLSHK